MDDKSGLFLISRYLKSSICDIQKGSSFKETEPKSNFFKFHILNISQEGVKKARYRLRKKLAITTEDSFEDLVIQI